jgi:hypothetical protein
MAFMPDGEPLIGASRGGAVSAHAGKDRAPKIRYTLSCFLPPLCGLILLAGCAEHIEPVIEGVVVDALERKPLSGTAIGISGTTLSTTTDSDGHYRVSFVPGQFRVTASKQGYYPASLKLGIAQGAIVPAEPIVLYPEAEAAGYYAAVKAELRPLPSQVPGSVGNMMQTVRGLRETADLPAIAIGTRIFRRPATGAAVRLARLDYQESIQVEGMFGKQSGKADMWVEKGATQLEVVARVPGQLDEIRIPAQLEPGIYAFGEATAARSTIEAAMDSDKQVIAFVYGDPDRQFLQEHELNASLAVRYKDVQWGPSEHTDSFKEVAQFELGVDKTAFVVLCAREECGASSCSQECKVDHVASKKTVLKPTKALYADFAAGLLFEDDVVWRDECHACPHHALYRRHQFDPAQGRFWTRSYVSPRLHGLNGPIGATWNGAIRLDEENGFRDVKLGTPLSAIQKLMPVESQPDCFTRDGEDLRVGKAQLQRVEYCFQSGTLGRIRLVPKEVASGSLLDEMASLYGLGLEVQAPGRRRWPGKRVQLECSRSVDGKEAAAVFTRTGAATVSAQQAAPSAPQ